MGHSRGDVFVGLAFEMKAQLVGQLLVDGPTPNERADAVEEVAEHVAF
jgi:hypothetical protein